MGLGHYHLSTGLSWGRSGLRVSTLAFTSRLVCVLLLAPLSHTPRFLLSGSYKVRGGQRSTAHAATDPGVIEVLTIENPQWVDRECWLLDGCCYFPEAVPTKSGKNDSEKNGFGP